ncbi:MAG: hypothetical protein EKK48_07770 [Candidatus Melainabacteria bacterium]|nr:MAG: hypothetical protein EKK48_07770 [Candidatus Melainabacteria bacterium]
MRQTNPTKTIVENVLTPQRVRELWSSNYSAVIPITPQDFSMEAVLPAVLYMFRWGHRRGAGKFASAFTSETEPILSIDQIAKKLVEKDQWFANFKDETTLAILGDLLLTYCLENTDHSTGRTNQVIRAFPTHYFASWIDLPKQIGHLRSVPEMIVALLVDQPDGSHIESGRVKSRFSAGRSMEDNELLKLLGTGVYSEGREANVSAERYSESAEIGIDQLLTVRMAQSCTQAPQKLRGPSESGLIPNSKPLSKNAAQRFSRDLSVFLQAYGTVIPRHALIPMLEACLSLGLSNIFLSSAQLALGWEKTNELSLPKEDRPWQLFVDCSSGANNDLRRLAEESFEDCFRRLDRLPITLMTMRILDQAVSYDEDMRAEVKSLKQSPHSEGLLNLLGAIRDGRHENSQFLAKDLKRKCRELADALEADEEQLAVTELLRNPEVEPATRLGEALVALMGDKLNRSHFQKALESCLMVDSPSGLASKRKVMVSTMGKKRLTEARSIVLTNTMIDFLVHRHLRKDKKGKGEQVLSLQNFLVLLRERYGLFVDRSPEGMPIANELLSANKKFLERRLRDLGLLVGVNDAETMKRLTARYVAEDNSND